MLVIDQIIKINTTPYKVLYTGLDETISLYIINLHDLNKIYFSYIKNNRVNLISKIFDTDDLEILITSILNKLPIKNNFVLPIKSINIQELRTNHPNIYKKIQKFHISELILDNISSILISLSLFMFFSIFVFIMIIADYGDILVISYPTVLFLLALFIWCKLKNIQELTRINIIIKKNKKIN